MSSRLKSLFKFFIPFIIFLIALFISYKNYIPGTFLLGWDSLHPEFDFKLNFARVFSGVWRQDQGIGALASHSHMADVSRIVILWIESFFLPQNMLRYSYIFLCLILGPLGFYFLFDYALNKKKTFGGSLASFLASIFYLLNLTILQHFFVPFEMFPAQFAFLPWVFLFVLKYLREGKKKNLFLFSFMSFLASPQAYASALYWAFLASFLGFLFFYFILDRKKETLKKALLLFVCQILVNSYWLLPNLYGVFSGSAKTIVNARINQLFSPEAFIRNEEYGTWKDLILGKNFLFDWRAFDFKANTFSDLMALWNNYLEKPWVKEIGYFFFAVSLFGFIFSLLKREKVSLAFLPILIITLFFLQNLNGPLGFVYQILVDRFEIFREGFRMPFTKFSILYQFVLSFYFGAFFFYLFNLLSKNRWLRVFNLIVSFAILASLVYFMKPVFEGHFISDVVRRPLPTEYLMLFDYFKSREGRIAVFPVYSLWGWEYHNWGYEGSGFLGFGLNNPLLVRDYDRWSPYNETFYNEASNVLYKYNLVDLDKDGPCQGKKECGERNKAKEKIEEWNLRVVREFESILSKYNVSYLLLDESILNAGGDEKLLFIPQIKDLISHSSGIKEAAKFGFLTVYEFSGTGSDPVQSPKEYVEVDANLTYSKYDFIYQKYGEYINYQEGKGKITGYPFVNFDPRGDVKISLRKTIDGQNQLVFENNRMNAKVVLPFSEAIEEKFGEDQGFKEGYNCDLKKKGTAIKNRLAKGNFYAALEGGVSCDWFYYPQVSRSKAYVLRIKGENLKGRSLKIYLQNLRTGRMDLEELLPQGSFDSYFVIFPTEPDLSEAGSQELIFGVQPGYTLNVETRSFGRIASENIIEDITFIPIDIDWLYQITSLSGDAPQETKNNLQIASYKKYGTWGYKVETLGDGVLKLAQGYDEGWIALEIPNSKLQITNIKLLEHNMINSWANGWVVRPSVDRLSAVGSQVETDSRKLTADRNTVLVFYWPQFLEWGGFALGFLLFLVLVVGVLRNARKF